MSKQTHKSYEVGTIRKKGDKVYLVLNKDVRILRGESELDSGEYRTVYFKNIDEVSEDLDFKVSKGWISEEEKEEKLDALEKRNVKYVLNMREK